jgi:hypothetical protein
MNTAVCSPAYALASALIGRDTHPDKLFAEADRLARAAKRAGVRIAHRSAALTNVSSRVMR